MAAIFVVVVDVRAHKPNKMVAVKNDHMIKELPAAAADPSLRDATLPGTSKSDAAWFDAHSFDESNF